MTATADTLRARLAHGGVVVLDGGTGTELQRRGAAMHDGAWSAAATLSDATLLRQIHEDYIRAGADVVTTNTYASNRSMLEHAGLGERFEAINRRAVEVAREARAHAAGERAVAVAGSISHMMPMVHGHDYRDESAIADRRTLAAGYRDLADLLADAGVDLLLMEMMSDPDLALPAIEAARATGLPVWVGLSCRAGADGSLVAFSRPQLPFAAAAREILAAGAQAAGVMHSHTHLTTRALAELKTLWPGVLMAYPDSGYFTMPEWHFDERLDPGSFADIALGWRRDGVQVLGGCCGLGVDHIAALVRALGPGTPA